MILEIPECDVKILESTYTKKKKKKKLIRITSFSIVSDNRSIINLLIFNAFNHRRGISRPFLN